MLNFEKCAGLTLSHFTMGHTPDRGECDGGVIALYTCSGVLLDSVDLYGCGVFGLKAINCTEGVAVRNSILRDCSDGPFSVSFSPCEILFVGCALTGSDGGGYYEPAEAGGSALRFINCEFGKAETDAWKDSAAAQFDGCIFGVMPGLQVPTA